MRRALLLIAFLLWLALTNFAARSRHDHLLNAWSVASSSTSSGLQAKEMAGILRSGLIYLWFQVLYLSVWVL